MPTQYDMAEDTILYRAVFEHDYTPGTWQANPNTPDGYPRVYVVTGPVETKSFVKGPYTTTQPIKAFMTRQRDRYKNLRIKKVEMVTEWTETVL